MSPGPETATGREVERAWMRGKPARIVATRGAERSVIDTGQARRRAA